MKSDLPILSAIRDELVEGIARHEHASTPLDPRASVPGLTRRRSWLAAAAIVAVISLAVLIVPTLVSDGPRGAAAFAVQEDGDGRIHVTVRSDFDQSERLAAELKARGVEVIMIDVPAHPTLVGTIEVPLHQLPPGGTEVGDGEFWIDPQQFDGEVEILVYRDPESGERWRQAPSVFHPDEPLGGLPCASEGPMDTQTLERAAVDKGLQVEWIVLTKHPSTADSIELEIMDQRPEGQIWAAQRVAETVIEATVLPAELAEQDGDMEPPSMSLNTHTERFEGGEPPCTPELTDLWG